jgi:uncharacterized protein (UPF0216 family)
VFSDKTLAKMFQSMNEHIPAVRPNLADLLESKEPAYKGKDGRSYLVDRKELELLAKNLDKWDWPRLKIPILLMTDTSYEGGMWKVIGRTEVSVISKIIGREPEREDEILIFYPQLMDIRKLLPTCTNCMYMP